MFFLVHYPKRLETQINIPTKFQNNVACVVFDFKSLKDGQTDGQMLPIKDNFVKANTTFQPLKEAFPVTS